LFSRILVAASLSGHTLQDDNASSLGTHLAALVRFHSRTPSMQSVIS
jgi:hypothetical protein